MRYGYARVSTALQAKDGHSLEAQEKTLRESGADLIFSDQASGRSAERPSFGALMDALLPGDTLIVTKLDRIARSLSDGSRLVDELLRRGVKLHILNLGVLDDSPASKLIRHVFFAFAEFERELIAERAYEGKAIAKTKAGFREGRPPKFTEAQIHHALSLLETHSYQEIERMTQISKSTLIRAKRSARRSASSPLA